MSQADIDVVYGLHREVIERRTETGLLAWTEHFAPDVMMQPPGEPVVKGLEAVLRWAKETDETVQVETMSAHDEEYVDAGDYIIETGQFSWSVRPRAGGEAEESSGKWLAVWQRQADGSWKIVRDMWNGDG